MRDHRLVVRIRALQFMHVRHRGLDRDGVGVSDADHDTLGVLRLNSIEDAFFGDSGGRRLRQQRRQIGIRLAFLEHPRERPSSDVDDGRGSRGNLRWRGSGSIDHELYLEVRAAEPPVSQSDVLRERHLRHSEQAGPNVNRERLPVCERDRGPVIPIPD